MYDNLMARLYSTDNVSVNETDGMYQVNVKETSYNKRTEKEERYSNYNVYIKDNKFKITCFLRDKVAYKYLGDGVLDGAGRFLAKLNISQYASSMVNGVDNKFDF